VKKKFNNLVEKFIVPPEEKVSLAKDYKSLIGIEGFTKDDFQQELYQGIERLAEEQSKLYAEKTYSLLIIFQAMDAAGKDSTIKHVMSGINPQGCQVYSFKAPTSEDLAHDYLWRAAKCLPERGSIGIFNRSYYEEVLVVRVHPEILAAQRIPPELKDKQIWKRRFKEINNFESYLVNQGIVVLKFFLYVSKEQQKKRFLERIDLPDKNWKFSADDARDRQRWDDYIDAYEDCFSNTSTKVAPWYIIPADHKPFTRLAVAQIIHAKLKELKLSYPTIDDRQLEELAKAKKILLSEKK
jgi:PPK2 family polyphosphate:nucleotide phosphotransferase